MATRTRPRPQISLYETSLDNPELEAQLEQRETLKEKSKQAGKAYREIHDKVKVAVDVLDIADGPVRVGRFVVSQKPTAGRTVSFETNPTTRLTIHTLDEEL